MIVAWIPVFAALLGTSSSGSREFRPIEHRGIASSAAVVLAGPPLAPRADASGPPPCVGDVCQPRVAVPGYEPRLSIRGKRTELAAQLLDRANLEPLASISQFLVATGLRLDLRPAALDPSTVTNGSGGNSVQLMLRWRIDALGKPVWAGVR